MLPNLIVIYGEGVQRDIPPEVLVADLGDEVEAELQHAQLLQRPENVLRHLFQCFNGIFVYKKNMVFTQMNYDMHAGMQECP